MSTMKLQKLVYYSQAWSLVWDERPLFPEKVQAWAGGPVVAELFQAHQGEFSARDEPKGDRKKLDATAKETIDAVIRDYGDKTGAWLSELTHCEKPWIDARKGLPDGARGTAEITHAAMANYYSNL
ncbi:MAG: Panacea domain-containing protein [Brevundimonas sp.]